jgi:hypothetical protein
VFLKERKRGGAVATQQATHVAAGLELARAAAGRAVSYRRGAASVALVAIRGRTPYEAVTARGATETLVSTDYLVQASELVLSGSVTQPARGDRIDEVIGGQTVTHEVLPVSPNDQPFSPMDPDATWLRVHTRKV